MSVSDESVNINKIKKRIKNSDNLTVGLAKIFAENLGKILLQYKKELNFNDLAKKALKKPYHSKPSELLGRYRVYPNKKYTKKVYERLAKDPKKYLSIIEEISEKIPLDHEALIRQLVSRTRFEDINLSQEDEAIDFEPVDKINEYIKIKVIELVEKYNLNNFSLLRQNNPFRMFWDKAKQEYSFIKVRENPHFLFEIPIFEKIDDGFGRECLHIIEDNFGNIQKFKKFIFFSKRINFALVEDQGRIIPKIVIRPCLFVPGIKKINEEIPSFYFFSTPELDLDNNDNEYNYCLKFNNSDNKNENPFGSITFKKNCLESYNYSHKIYMNHYCGRDINYFYDEDLFLEKIIETQDDIYEYDWNLGDPIFYDLDNKTWVKRYLLSDIKNIIGREGTAFFNKYRLSESADYVLDSETKNNSLFVEFYSSLLNKSAGIANRADIIKSYILKFLEVSHSDGHKVLNDQDEISDYNFELTDNYCEVYSDNFNNPQNGHTKTYFNKFNSGFFNFLDILEFDIRAQVDKMNITLNKEKEEILSELDNSILEIKKRLRKNDKS